MNDRPLCKCHGVPMYANGVRSPWRCAVKQKERNTLRVRIGVGGDSMFIGYAPTPEAHDQLRQMVAQAPRATTADA